MRTIYIFMPQEGNLGRKVGRLHYLLTRNLTRNQQAHNTGITADQFRLLTNLWRTDGLTQQQLADLLGRDRASITRMVDILEKCGLLLRQPDASDRRVNRVFLTEKGKELEQTATQVAKQCLEKMTCNFSEEERIQFHSLLDKAIENLVEGA